MGQIDCVILDFDGTFTDAQAEAVPFTDAYRANLEDVLGRSVSRMWEEEARVILAAPAEFGWHFGGKVVAPATADPYLLATAIAQRIFDRLVVLQTLTMRTEVTQALYRESYRHTATAFKPEAREVLEAILATDRRVFVVTNSNTEVVSQKIDQLAPRGRERLQVIGDAKKYVVDEPSPVDDLFRPIPAERMMPGLDTRPVLLRRGRYYEVLSRIWAETGTTPENTLVCGDIWELDLSLPQTLGTHVHLVLRSTTLDYERNAVAEAGPRGGVSASLRELLPRLSR